MNKTTIIGIVSFFVIGLLLGSQLHGCIGWRETRGRGGEAVIHSDTLVRYLPRIDTQWHTIELTNNIPYTVRGHDTVYVKKVERITGRDTTWLTQYLAVTDTVAYSDTLRRANEFKAELFDTLAGNRIIGRSLRWADLTPIEVKTIMNTVMKKPPLIKVFVGADAYGGKAGSKINIDLAPSASVVLADRYMLDLGYYIFNQQFTAGLKVKLSFRK
jgi:hypothetical protein